MSREEKQEFARSERTDSERSESIDGGKRGERGRE